MELSEIPGDRAALLVWNALDPVAKSANKHSKKTRVGPPNIIVFPTTDLFIVFSFIPFVGEKGTLCDTVCR